MSLKGTWVAHLCVYHIGGSLHVLILWMRLREGMTVARGHTASKKGSLVLNSRLFEAKPHTFPLILCHRALGRRKGKSDVLHLSLELQVKARTMRVVTRVVTGVTEQ